MQRSATVLAIVGAPRGGEVALLSLFDFDLVGAISRAQVDEVLLQFEKNVVLMICQDAQDRARDIFETPKVEGSDDPDLQAALDLSMDRFKLITEWCSRIDGIESHVESLFASCNEQIFSQAIEEELLVLRRRWDTLVSLRWFSLCTQMEIDNLALLDDQKHLCALISKYIQDICLVEEPLDFTSDSSVDRLSSFLHRSAGEVVAMLLKDFGLLDSKEPICVICYDVPLDRPRAAGCEAKKPVVLPVSVPALDLDCCSSILSRIPPLTLNAIFSAVRPSNV